MASFKKRGEHSFIVRWREGGRDSRQLSRVFKTEAEALKFKAEVDRPRADDSAHREVRRMFQRGELTTYEAVFLGLAPEGTALDREWSLQGYIARVIEADLSLRPTTRHLYLRNLRVHIEGTELGRADVRAITPEQLTEWWKGLSAGVGARRNAYQLLAKALNRAVLVGDIESSPLRRAPEVKRPGKNERQSEIEPLTYEQLMALAEAARQSRRGLVGQVAEMAKERDRLEVLVMGVGGLRAGEVGGLRVQDMVRAEDRCQLRLRQQVTRVTGRGAAVSPLKTAAGRRTVTIPCWLWDELQTFLANHPAAQDGRAFHGPNGEMRAHTAVNHAVSSAGRRIQMDVNAHQLRHTAVSLLIDAGANPKAIQAFVGHSDINMTLGTYGHLFDQGGAALAEIMADLHERHRKRS